MCKSIGELLTQEMEYPSVWLSKSLVVAAGRTRRIIKGDYVAVQDGNLTDVTGVPTHRITRLSGPVTGTPAKVELQEIGTKQIITIVIN